MSAALTHYVSPERLQGISGSIPKVIILSGAEDHLANMGVEGEKMKRYMPEAEYQCWEKTGHGISGQHKVRFNGTLERVFKEGNENAKKMPITKRNVG